MSLLHHHKVVAASITRSENETSAHAKSARVDPDLRAHQFLFCRLKFSRRTNSHPIQEDYTLPRFSSTRVVTNLGYLEPFDTRTLPFVRTFTPLVGYRRTVQDDGRRSGRLQISADLDTSSNRPPGRHTRPDGPRPR